MTLDGSRLSHYQGQTFNVDAHLVVSAALWLSGYKGANNARAD